MLNSPEEPRLIAERFELQMELGAGAMGAVYQALDRRLGRTVAIKLIQSKLADDPEIVARFEREARAIAALSHPNVITIFDYGHDRSGPYLVTELLDGKTLTQALETGPLEATQALGLARSIAGYCRRLQGSSGLRRTRCRQGLSRRG